MKITVTKTVERNVEIEVELPFYFKHELDIDGSDCVIYGKVEESRCTCIKIGHITVCDEYEVSIEHRPAAYYSSYMIDKRKSNKDEFMKAAGDMLEAFTDATGEQK